MIINDVPTLRPKVTVECNNIYDGSGKIEGTF
jgi:hypothetical protein